MGTFTVASSTIGAIFGQLGDPDAVGMGYIHEGAIPYGQVVAPNEFGGESYTPKAFSYIAKVINVNGKLEWEIQSMKIIGDESAKLRW